MSKRDLAALDHLQRALIGSTLNIGERVRIVAGRHKNERGTITGLPNGDVVVLTDGVYGRWRRVPSHDVRRLKVKTE